MNEKRKKSEQDEGNENLEAKKAKLADGADDGTDGADSAEIDIKLTDILGIEYAITTLQNSILKIIHDTPDYDQLIKFIKHIDMDDPFKKEIFIALSRNQKIKLASKLKSMYNNGSSANLKKMFDDILDFKDKSIEDDLFENDSIGVYNTPITTNDSDEGCSTKDSDGDERHDHVGNSNYPPPLPKVSNPVLLSRVFMHKSVVNDKKYLSDKELVNSNYERLEFLGDSVLNNLITLIIYDYFPEFNEGELSKVRIELINNQTLTTWSKLYGFDKELRKNISDNAFYKGKMKIFADVFEAYVGALTLEKKENMEAIKNWLKLLSLPILDKFEEKNSTSTSTLNKNAKSELYSLVGCAAMPPKYDVVKTGDGSDQSFVVACSIKGEEIGRGRGNNIKEAGLRAAMDALSNKPKVEKYSMIRRQMPRSISVLRGESPESALTDEGNQQHQTDKTSVHNINISKSGVLPPPQSSESSTSTVGTGDTYNKSTPGTNISVVDRHLPLTPPPIKDYLIDVEAKGRLYSLLTRFSIKPLYDIQKLSNNNIQCVLSLNGVPLVATVDRNSKLAGHRCAQYILENTHLLKDYGIIP